MKTFNCCLLFIIFSYKGFAQEKDTLQKEIIDRYIKSVNDKFSSAKKRISKKTILYFEKIKRLEKKISDRISFNSLFNIPSSHSSGGLLQKNDDVEKFRLPVYIPYVDSLQTALKFLEKAGGNNTLDAIKHISQVQKELMQAEKINRLFTEIKDRINQSLSKYTGLPAGLARKFQKLSKTVYYYKAQVNEYKSLLQDREKIEQKTISLLNKLPAFKKFMEQNSQLAGMFVTGEPGNVLAGLQSRQDIQQLIAERISFDGINGRNLIEQNLSAAHRSVNNILDKLNKYSQINSVIDPDIPAFKPNEQKTKTFLKRIEFGSNIQLQRSNRFYPSTTGIGINIGYKLNDKSVVGGGITYNAGWKKNFHLYTEGIDVRSFADWKIKRSIFISGGYEKKYKPEINSTDQLNRPGSWQTSGLIGVTAKYKISKKLGVNAQLLWDFLSYRSHPATQPLIYRIGYSLIRGVTK